MAYCGLAMTTISAPVSAHLPSDSCDLISPSGRPELPLVGRQRRGVRPLGRQRGRGGLCDWGVCVPGRERGLEAGRLREAATGGTVPRPPAKSVGPLAFRFFGLFCGRVRV